MYFLFLFFVFLPPTAGLPLGVLNLAKIKPYQRGFFCNDDSIKYPFHDSTITSTVLYTVGFTLPIFSVSSVYIGSFGDGSKMYAFQQLSIVNELKTSLFRQNPIYV